MTAAAGAVTGVGGAWVAVVGAGHARALSGVGAGRGRAADVARAWVAVIGAGRTRHRVVPAVTETITHIAGASIAVGGAGGSSRCGVGNAPIVAGAELRVTYEAVRAAGIGEVHGGAIDRAQARLRSRRHQNRGPDDEEEQAAQCAHACCSRRRSAHANRMSPMRTIPPAGVPRSTIEQPPPFEPPGEGSAMSVGALAMGPEPKSALVRQMH